MTARRPATLLLVALLALGASIVPPAAVLASATWVFPSSDCTQPDGLQACIDKTAPGDTIQIDLDPLSGQGAPSLTA